MRRHLPPALAAAAALLFPTGTETARAQTTSGPEIRGLWVSRFEWPQSSAEATRARIDTIMNRARDARFNAVFMQVRGQCDTLYPSPEEPWSRSFNHTSPGFDPLAYAVEAAHARGLEFHAYINTHVIWQTSTSSPAPPPAGLNPPHPYYLFANPSDPARREWCYATQSGVQPLGAGEDGYLWAAPGVPSFQHWVRRQILHVARNYPVDGIHLDRIRTAGTGSYDPVSVARHAGPGNPAGLGFQAWNRDQITRFLNDLYGSIAEVNRWRPAGKPLIKVSTAPYRGRSQQLSVNQDVEAWCALGAQDFFCPQVYTTSLSAFQTALDTNFPLAHGRYVVAGLSRNIGGQTMATLFGEIRTARSLGARGSVVFSYSGFQSGDWGQLPLNVFGNTVPTPDMPWLTNPTDAIIVGQVRDGAYPVLDAWVKRTGSSYTWTSGEDGFFAMLKVPAGTPVTVTATHPAGRGTRTVEVGSLAPGEVRRLDLNFGPQSYVGFAQKVRVASGGGWQELFYNYETGAVSVSPYAATPGPASHVRPKEQWVGIFHYDYTAGRFTQALYQYGDLL